MEILSLEMMPVHGIPLMARNYLADRPRRVFISIAEGKFTLSNHELERLIFRGERLIFRGERLNFRGER